jgi:hypothetical protein
MKIFNRHFIWPFLVHKTSTYYGGCPDLTINVRKSGINGSMRSKSLTIDIRTKTKTYQWSFCWRPYVTAYWWNKSINK